MLPTTTATLGFLFYSAVLYVSAIEKPNVSTFLFLYKSCHQPCVLKDLAVSVAVAYHCLAPYYGYLPEYDHHNHEENDSR